MPLSMHTGRVLAAVTVLTGAVNLAVFCAEAGDELAVNPVEELARVSQQDLATELPAPSSELDLLLGGELTVFGVIVDQATSNDTSSAVLEFSQPPVETWRRVQVVLGAASWVHERTRMDDRLAEKGLHIGIYRKGKHELFVAVRGLADQVRSELRLRYRDLRSADADLQVKSKKK